MGLRVITEMFLLLFLLFLQEAVANCGRYKVLKKLYVANKKTQDCVFKYTRGEHKNKKVYKYSYKYHKVLNTIPDNIPHDVSEIWLNHNNIETIPKHAFTRLISLKFLDLRSNKLKYLVNGTFYGLSLLTRLLLYANEIARIDTGAFEGLLNLNELHLGDYHGNLLTHIRVGMWKGLDNISMKLKLTNNQISGIDIGAFNKLSKLQNLYLENNHLTTIQKGILTGLVSLHTLYLSQNKIDTIEDNPFYNLTCLQQLSLNYNKLRSVDKNMFQGIPNLKFLYLQNNKISHLPPDIFTHVKQLKAIFLSGNFISNIDAIVFKNTEYLERISLANNNITSIHKSMFAGHNASLTQLKELHLDKNNIQTIQKGSFSQFNLNSLCLTVDISVMETMSWKVFTNDSITVKNINLMTRNKIMINFANNRQDIKKMRCTEDNCWIKHGYEETVIISLSCIPTSVSKSLLSVMQFLIFKLDDIDNCYWSSICPNKELCGLDEDECSSKCISSGYGVGKQIISEKFCPFETFCNCSCLDFNISACAKKCKKERKSPSMVAVKTTGCKMCDCSCPLFEIDFCDEFCTKMGKGQKALNGKFDENGCQVCKCTCPTFNHTLCTEQCVKVGKISLMNAVNKKGCQICDCTCPAFDINWCEANCKLKGMVHVIEAKDDFGCEVCRCECGIYNHIFCEAQCVKKGKVPVINAVNKEGCKICNCTCPEFNNSQCDAKCNKKSMVPAIGATDEYSCEVCKCTCPIFNHNLCENQCFKRGKIPLLNAVNKEGCKICDCTCSSEKISSCKTNCSLRGMVPVPGPKDDFDCDVCNCECPKYNHTFCEAQCVKKGKIPLMNAVNKKGCDICECTCPTFNINQCETNCNKKGMASVIGAKDDFGCKACNCECPKFDNKSCESQCRINGTSAVVGAMNSDGCNICNCSCPLFKNTECGPSCNREYNVSDSGCKICACECPYPSYEQREATCRKKGLVPSGTRAGCQTRRCICARFSSEKCYTKCSKEGKVPNTKARNKGGCQICECKCPEPKCSTKCAGHQYTTKANEFNCTECVCDCPKVNCSAQCDGSGLVPVVHQDKGGCPVCGGCKPVTCRDCDAECNGTGLGITGPKDETGCATCVGCKNHTEECVNCGDCNETYSKTDTTTLIKNPNDTHCYRSCQECPHVERYTTGKDGSNTTLIAVITTCCGTLIILSTAACNAHRISRCCRINEGNAKQMQKVGRHLELSSLLEYLEPDLADEVAQCWVDPKYIKLRCCVGHGNFGVVLHGILVQSDGKENKTIDIALKKSKEKLDGNCVEEFLREAVVMRMLDHPNVLSLIGVSLNDDKPCVLMPFMSNGDLNTYLVDHKPNLETPQLLSFAVDVAKGMEYLAEQKFVHRDLAARNCMLDKDMIVKVADFGLTRDIYQNDYYRTESDNRRLPIKWMSIEAIRQSLFTTKSDVWSYGVLLWEIFTFGAEPYNALNNTEVATYLLQNHRLHKPSVASEELYDLMLSCWSFDPEERPTFTEILTMLNTFMDPNTHYYSKLLQDTEEEKQNVNEGYLEPVSHPKCCSENTAELKNFTEDESSEERRVNGGRYIDLRNKHEITQPDTNGKDVHIYDNRTTSEKEEITIQEDS